MDHLGPKNSQIDETICQGPRRTCQKLNIGKILVMCEMCPKLTCDAYENNTRWR